MTYKITNIPQGYKPDPKDERDNVFGSGETPAPIILPSGNWNDLFTPDEFQYRGFETFSCVTFSFLNAAEKLAKLIFNEIWDKSERFTYIASGTNPADKGNSPRAVADSIRHKGVIDERDLPFDDSIDTIEKFNAPIPLTQELLDKTKPFLRDYEFRYDFLPTTRGEVTREMLRAGLYRAPICVAVYAWAEKDGKYYRLDNDTHLTLLTNVKDNGELEVFDSYAPSHKTLSADYPIYTAIRVFLRKKTEAEKQAEEKKTNFILSAYQWIISALTYLVEYYAKHQQDEKKTLEDLQNATTTPKMPQIEAEEFKRDNMATQHETMQEMVKRVCREEKLTPIMSERLYKTIECESHFNPKAIHRNRSKKTGKITSTDWGIAQINDYYHIGKDKAFPTAEYVLNNPEECIKWMARLFQQGKANVWVCYQKLYL